jgi:ribosomal-protein-alanine N-acetyltransferase
MIANPSALAPVIREMRQTDVARVAWIEREAYEFPWSPGIFRDCLLAGYTSVVMEFRGDVIAYAIVSVAAGEAHLLNLCVARNFRRAGHARQLLDVVMDRACQAGAERIHLEVRPSNDAALALYAGYGFERVGLRKHYYRASAGSEDAVLLARSLTQRQPDG